MDDRVQPLGQGLFDGVRFLGLDPGGAEFGTLRTLNHVTEQALHLLECRLDYRPSLLEHSDRVALCRQQELDVVEEAGHVGRLGTDLCGIGRPQLAGDDHHPVAVLGQCLGRFRGETCLGRLRDVQKGVALGLATFVRTGCMLSAYLRTCSTEEPSCSILARTLISLGRTSLASTSASFAGVSPASVKACRRDASVKIDILKRSPHLAPNVSASNFSARSFWAPA